MNLSGLYLIPHHEKIVRDVRTIRRNEVNLMIVSLDRLGLASREGVDEEPPISTCTLGLRSVCFGCADLHQRSLTTLVNVANMYRIEKEVEGP